MANDLNQCSFIGRLGADPETRYAASGDAVCSLRLAVGWKGKDKEGTEWIPCTAFGKLAEICGKYLVKGSQVFVQGRFKTDEYEKDGVKRYRTKIMIDQMQMLGSKQDGQRPQPEEGQPATQRSAQGAPPNKASFDDLGDDIPFLCHARGIVGHCM